MMVVAKTNVAQVAIKKTRTQVYYVWFNVQSSEWVRSDKAYVRKWDRQNVRWCKVSHHWLTFTKALDNGDTDYVEIIVQGSDCHDYIDTLPSLRVLARTNGVVRGVWTF